MNAQSVRLLIKRFVLKQSLSDADALDKASQVGE